MGGLTPRARGSRAREVDVVVVIAEGGGDVPGAFRAFTLREIGVDDGAFDVRAAALVDRMGDVDVQSWTSACVGRGALGVQLLLRVFANVGSTVLRNLTIAQ